jgi:pimeloyl-ACP methyl ester carboxylesterase
MGSPHHCGILDPGCSMALTDDLERNLLEIPVPPSGRVDVYSGVARLSGAIWASEVRLRGLKPDTAVVFIHPTANFLGHYALPTLASFGVAAIGMTTRYIGNDSNLNVENCILDIGATVRYLREHGYQRVILLGNSGGGTVVPYYQAQAEHPSVTAPPGGGPDLTAAGLLPADALVLFMAHPSRARLSMEWLDPAITDESAPFNRDADLDAFNPRNGPPFSAEFIGRYRAAQLERNRRITSWAEEQLAELTGDGHWPRGLDDLAFVVHGTSADLRFLDAAIDASDRPTGSTLWGAPEVANYLPAGVSRYTTLRSWINQWSVDKTLGNALLWLPKVEAPVLVLGGSADTGSPPAVFGQLYDAVEMAQRKQIVLDGATHYFEGQPGKLREACEAVAAW